MDVINELILQTVASPWLFVVLLAVTIVDGFFPPVPSETVLVAAAAVLASTGDVWALLPLGLVAALGATIGDNLAFALEKQSKADEARSLYEKVLQLEATNKTALKRLSILERRSGRDAGGNGKAS